LLDKFSLRIEAIRHHLEGFLMTCPILIIDETWHDHPRIWSIFLRSMSGIRCKVKALNLMNSWIQV
jgi:hypothetical protein